MRIIIILRNADYHHLTQCDLSETDYGRDVADLGTLNLSDYQEAAMTKVRRIAMVN